MNQVRNIAFWSALLLFLLEVIYIVVLTIGLYRLPSTDSPIQDPWFTLMELLILAIAPLLVVLLAGLHYQTPEGQRLYTLCALSFMLALCVVTMGLHFSILTLSHLPAFSGPPWSTLVFPFRWPSLAYAADILAWDVLWPLSMVPLALSFRGSGLARWIRGTLLLSALLAALGLMGVVTANMQYRNLGILGYVPVFMVSLIFIAVLLRRQRED